MVDITAYRHRVTLEALRFGRLLAYYNLLTGYYPWALSESQKRPYGGLILGLNLPLTALDKRHPLLTFANQHSKMLLAPPFGLSRLAYLAPEEWRCEHSGGRACW